MINLLPPELKTNIRYARRNMLLRNWAIALVISISTIGSVVGMGYLYLYQTTATYAKQIEQGKTNLASQKLEETQAEVQNISNNLKLVIDVLSREVLFSGLITQIGTVIPDGAVLTSLSISSVEGALDLQLAAVDYETGTQAQVNLADAENKIFDKADILSIQCASNNDSDGLAGTYPCNVQVRAQFSKDNPFLFIKPKGSGAKS